MDDFLLWALIMNTIPVCLFLIGGLVRYFELMEIGQSNINFSRLFKFKFTSYACLILLESLSLTLKTIQFRNKDKIGILWNSTLLQMETNSVDSFESQEDTRQHLYNTKSTNLLLIGLILVDLLNLASVIFALHLLVYEYRRRLSEKWYSHIQFMWVSLATNTLHLTLFCQFYARVQLILTVIRISLFILLLFQQLFTAKRSLSRGFLRGVKKFDGQNLTMPLLQHDSNYFRANSTHSTFNSLLTPTKSNEWTGSKIKILICSVKSLKDSKIVKFETTVYNLPSWNQFRDS